MMPRRRPSARVLLLALTASLTVFFLSCGIPNYYPNDIRSIFVYENEQFSDLRTDKAYFNHTINTDVETIGYNFYYTYSDKSIVENSDELELNVESAEVMDRINVTPQMEIVDKTNNPIYGIVKYDNTNNTFSSSLYASPDNRNAEVSQITLHNGETSITIKDETGNDFTEVDKNLHLYIEYVLVDKINMYDFPPKEKVYLGYITLE
jgi:hypothetical protein